MQLTNKVNFRNIQGGIFGAVTAAVIAFPMALAFGVVFGIAPDAGAVAGLWEAVLIGFFAALFWGHADPDFRTHRSAYRDRLGRRAFGGLVAAVD